MKNFIDNPVIIINMANTANDEFANNILPGDKDVTQFVTQTLRSSIVMTKLLKNIKTTIEVRRDMNDVVGEAYGDHIRINVGSSFPNAVMVTSITFYNGDFNMLSTQLLGVSPKNMDEIIAYGIKELFKEYGSCPEFLKLTNSVDVNHIPKDIESLRVVLDRLDTVWSKEKMVAWVEDDNTEGIEYTGDTDELYVAAPAPKPIKDNTYHEHFTFIDMVQDAFMVPYMHLEYLGQPGTVVGLDERLTTNAKIKIIIGDTIDLPRHKPSVDDESDGGGEHF